MEVRPIRSCETNGSIDNPRNPPDPLNPNASGRAERALAQDRLIEYLSAAFSDLGQRTQMRVFLAKMP